MTQHLFGASDDLIELEGDITEEFTAIRDDEKGFVGFSNGTVLRIHYNDDGIWEIRQVAGPKAEITQASGEDDGDTDEHGCPTYSDKAIIDDEIGWAVYGAGYASA